MTKSIILTIYKILYFYLNLNTLNDFCTLSYIYTVYFTPQPEQGDCWTGITNVSDASESENTQTCVHMCTCVWEYVSACTWVGQSRVTQAMKPPDREGGGDQIHPWLHSHSHFSAHDVVRGGERFRTCMDPVPMCNSHGGMLSIRLLFSASADELCSTVISGVSLGDSGDGPVRNESSFILVDLPCWMPSHWLSGVSWESQAVRDTSPAHPESPLPASETAPLQNTVHIFMATEISSSSYAIQRNALFCFSTRVCRLTW